MYIIYTIYNRLISVVVGGTFSHDKRHSCVQVLLTTELATYKCMRASASYKQLFTHLQEQNMIAQEVCVISALTGALDFVIMHVESEEFSSLQVSSL